MRDRTFAMVALAASVSVLAILAAQEPLPSRDSNPYQARIDQLQRQLIEVQNEVVHQRSDLANCKATVDSLDLTAQVSDLVKKYETAYGGTWTWDDKQRRVVRVPEKEK
jgi:hypothetical protein